MGLGWLGGGLGGGHGRICSCMYASVQSVCAVACRACQYATHQVSCTAEASSCPHPTVRCSCCACICLLVLMLHLRLPASTPPTPSPHLLHHTRIPPLRLPYCRPVGGTPPFPLPCL